MPSAPGQELLPVQTGTSLVYAFIRTLGDDHVLVVANLSRVPSTGHSLDLSEGPFEDAVSVRAVVGPEAAAPEIGPTGGFNGYVPVAEIPPYEVIVLVLE